MADQKVSALTAITDPEGADELYIVDDPAGTPASRKLTFENLRKLISGRVAHARRTAGNLSTSSTSWSDLDTGLDLTLTGVKAGDVVEVGVSGLWSNQNVTGYLDVGSLVSGAIVNTWGANGPESGTHQGVQSWLGINQVFQNIGSPVFRAVVAGDLDGGTLTLRFRRRNDTSSTKTMFASTDNPLQVWAKNHGQAA